MLSRSQNNRWLPASDDLRLADSGRDYLSLILERIEHRREGQDMNPVAAYHSDDAAIRTAAVAAAGWGIAADSARPAADSIHAVSAGAAQDLAILQLSLDTGSGGIFDGPRSSPAEQLAADLDRAAFLGDGEMARPDGGLLGLLLPGLQEAQLDLRGLSDFGP